MKNRSRVPASSTPSSRRRSMSMMTISMLVSLGTMIAPRRAVPAAQALVFQKNTNIRHINAQRIHQSDGSFASLHSRLFQSTRYQESSSRDSSEQATAADASGYARPVVQWYPGHIAKAERMLQETFKAVDVVVEVRDARIAKATSHPMVGAWCAGRPRLVVLTHADQIPGSCKKAWMDAYDAFGADQSENKIDRQVQNQARQAIQERLRYTPTESTAAAGTTSKKKNKNHNKNAAATVSPVEDVVFVNAKVGSGIHALTRSLFKAGNHIQERRERRGLKERPLRVGIIGYPNVGKSALINKLLGRRRAKSSNTPGVTRSLQWIRVRTDDSKAKRKEMELLDSPGIIPATLVDQSDATLLAACNCIGNAAYDNQAVAAYLCEWLIHLHRLGYGEQTAPEWRTQCQKRYGFDPLEDKVHTTVHPDIAEEEDKYVLPRTGEDMLFDVADATCQGDPEDAARKILQDFRSGRMGLICLQVAPISADEKGQRTVIGLDAAREREERQRAFDEEQRERTRQALATAKERGLELPPAVLEKQQSGTEVGNDSKNNDEAPSSSSSTEVGKGLFEGW